MPSSSGASFLTTLCKEGGNEHATKKYHPRIADPLRVAVLAAMDVLLMNYLGIHTQYFKIGFSFVPIALCGMLYGAKWSTACAGVGDLINCLLGPYGWYPPLTLSACLKRLFVRLFPQRAQ